MINRVCCCYFSPRDNARNVAAAIGQEIARALQVDCTLVSFTPPKSRTTPLTFTPNDLVVLATPVYAGRVPNKIMPYIRDCIHGEGAIGVPVVVFGNRSYDDALSELRRLMEANGFRPVAAAAVVTQHSFAPELASNRPDGADYAALRDFGRQIAEKAQREFAPLADVPGANPPTAYYTPLKTDGTPAKFLKAVPHTNPDFCIKCCTCVNLCPMGVISPEDPAVTTGPCIKCQACIHICPFEARSFTDPDFLSHRQMLQEHYRQRKESSFFL